MVVSIAAHLGDAHDHTWVLQGTDCAEFIGYFLCTMYFQVSTP